MPDRTPRLSESDTRPIDEFDDQGRYRGRDATFWTGYWPELGSVIPTFELADFAVGSGPANPHLRAVVRCPHSSTQEPVPVGVVSHSYPLVQHAELIEKCLEGVRKSKIDPHELRSEIGLTPFGEWMQFSLYFPDRFKSRASGQAGMDLRLTCLNSVDGGSGLVVLLGWLTRICRNGMVLGDALVDFRTAHGASLRRDFERIPRLIRDGLSVVDRDVERLQKWEATSVTNDQLEKWVNSQVLELWGKKAACRVLHICRSGTDIEIVGPFKGDPADLAVRSTDAVPGSVVPAENLFQVSQAASWVASQRANLEERLIWQQKVPVLVDGLAARLPGAGITSAAD